MFTRSRRRAQVRGRAVAQPRAASAVTVVLAAVTALTGCSTNTTDTGSPAPSATTTTTVTDATTTTTAAPPSGRYVALGSSYAAGPGGRFGGLPCGRSADNYPREVARELNMVLVDVTCSGSTTADILHVRQPHTAGPQIDAVTPDTGLVTITTGGNDLDYIGRLTAQSCRTELLLRRPMAACAGRSPIPPMPAPADYERLEDSLVEVVDAVRLRAPAATVILVDYPPVTVAGDRACSLLPVTSTVAAATLRVFGGLTEATRAAARRTHTRLVSAADAGRDHGVCSTRPWLSGFTRPAPYHPNARGKAAMAQLVLHELR